MKRPPVGGVTIRLKSLTDAMIVIARMRHDTIAHIMLGVVGTATEISATCAGTFATAAPAEHLTITSTPTAIIVAADFAFVQFFFFSSYR